MKLSIFSCFYPQILKTFICKDICTPTFTAALFMMAKIWKQLTCLSTDDWIKKMQYIYTIEHYSAISKDETLPFATAWINLENILWFHSYVGYKTESNKGTNKKNKEKFIASNSMVATGGKEAVGGSKA